MNLSFVLSFETGLYGLVHAHKLICSDTWALLQEKEYDYVVHFVHRHLLDRCICWANLDGFSDWILNQNNICPVPPCCRILCVCHTCRWNHSLTKWWRRDSWLCRCALAEWWPWMGNVSKIYLQKCMPPINWDGAEGNLSSLSIFILYLKIVSVRFFCVSLNFSHLALFFLLFLL